MIDVDVRIHDRFSVEFKIGYIVQKELKANDFIINTWMFVPNSLDINSFTYSKNQFYRDVKSNLRLITPIYQLEEVANEDSLPFQFLEVAFNEFIADPTKENLAESEYQVKMFGSILRSALRRETEIIRKLNDLNKQEEATQQYIQRIKNITHKYRTLKTILTEAGINNEALNYYSFGDEFLSNVIDFQSFRLFKLLQTKESPSFSTLKAKLIELIQQEREYRRAQGFYLIEKKSPDKNRAVFFHLQMLKKYIDSHLFLNANKKKDGQFAEQVSLSIAAGISMIFATTIAFSFQQKYGNFTMPLFVALVISYMLKDRIKELTRYYFVHRLAKKYYDNKTIISMKDVPVGWIKKGVDFITEDKVPEEIMEMRGRSDLFSANNRNTAEKIILYRTLVNIDSQALDENNQYDISGINDILRFNVSSFLLKMDNPEISLAIPDNDGNYELITGERVYYINFLIQLCNEDTIQYKRFRLTMSRNGIEGIENFN